MEDYMCFNQENRSVVLVGPDAKVSALRQIKNVSMEKQISRIQFRERQWKLKNVETTHPNPFTCPMHSSPATSALRNGPTLAQFAAQTIFGMFFAYLELLLLTLPFFPLNDKLPES